MTRLGPTDSCLSWGFPLERVHCGAPVGNGVQGVMVWGGGHTLRLTVSRAGFWDHRGSQSSLTLGLDYRQLESILEVGDTERLRRHIPAQSDRRSRQLGGGRFDIDLADWWLERAWFDRRRGQLVIEAVRADRKACWRLSQARDGRELFLLEAPEGEDLNGRVTFVSAFEYIGSRLDEWGISPPHIEQRSNGGRFVQPLPADDALAICWGVNNGSLTVATGLGQPGLAEAKALSTGVDGEALKKSSAEWWKAYYHDVPELELPDQDLQQMYDHGIYRQAGLTPPEGIAATLQGPWMEEYQLPPWSNDYHFNINVQMTYSACLPSGRHQHLEPLWTMLEGMMERFARLGREFFGVDDAMLIPTAIDDRGGIVGQYWTGMIDQGCTAWMGMLAWQHYRFSMDESILSRIAWPLLRGAFGGFWAMAREQDGKLWLPVTVSPEYRGTAINACGPNASFQLSAFHRTASLLPRIAELLGHSSDPRWRRVSEELPQYAKVGPEANTVIGLWDGLRLDESHRHHSHLAAIHPFRTLDVTDLQLRPLFTRTLKHWLTCGAGAWTAWSLPWAAQIVARCDMVDAAVGWLKWQRWVYMTTGHNALHDADFAGCGAWDGGTLGSGLFHRDSTWPGHNMQLDAAMGAISAICDLFVQNEDGELRTMRTPPKGWLRFCVKDIAAEGGVRISIRAERGSIQEIIIKAVCDTLVNLNHGLPMVIAEGPGHCDEQGRYRGRLHEGQRVALRRSTPNEFAGFSDQPRDKTVKPIADVVAG